MRVAALADDTTGALEVGAMLAGAGIRVAVVRRMVRLEDAEALVIDSQSRRMNAEEAYRTVRDQAHFLRGAGVAHLYKKTDSTLRGNIAAEFQAVLDVFPERLLVYVPAYPQMGRTVRGGELFVHGKPLAETEFARDASNPAREGNIPALVGAGCRAPVLPAPNTGEALEQVFRQAPDGAIVVCDGESPQDLSSAALALAASGRSYLAAGPAGFCGPWAQSLDVPRLARPERVPARRWLLASGSRHPASQIQLQRAAEIGIPVWPLEDDPAGDSRTAEVLAGRLEAQGWAALRTSGRSREDVSQRIGEIVRGVLELAPVDGLAVFGGDTAAGVLRALGVEVVRPQGEILPGLPYSRIEFRGRRLALVTKAGGFGALELLEELRRALE